MLALQALGWGSKRISRELGCSRNTVRQYLRQGGWRPMEIGARGSALQPHGQWLAERLRQHRGNADVVRQDLARELGIEVSLRTVQRAVAPLRRELRAEAVATVRYETAPGQQLQIDFGSTAVPVGGDVIRVHLFVATLGYSRRRVHTDACIELDTNRYSVPWKLIGETVGVIVGERQVRVLYAGQEVACHAQSPLRRASVIERAHLTGIVGAEFAGVSWLPRVPAEPPPVPPELLRPLEQYEAVLGGGW